MRASAWLIPLATVTVLIAGYAVVEHFGDAVPIGTTAKTEPAPDFTLPLVAGAADGRNTLTLAQLEGRPMIVNFWASWCAPCREERPELKLLGQSHPGAVVGIASLDSGDAVRKSESEHPHGYPIALDEDGVVAGRYNVKGLPQTLVLDGHGRILYRFAGRMTTVARREIEYLLQKQKTL